MPISDPESRLYRDHWADGSLDLFAGLAALTIGVSWIAGQAVFGAILPALLTSTYPGFRSRFVAPRVGEVRFLEPRRRKLQRGHLVLLAAGLLSCAGGVAAFVTVQGGTSVPGLLRSAIPGMPAALLGLAAFATAGWFELRRFAGYGLVLLLSGIGVAFSGVNPGLGLAVGGIPPTLIGAALFGRFLRGHPVLPATLD